MAISNARSNLIQRIGNVLVRVDVHRSGVARSSPRRIELDNLRDRLDACQRTLVRTTLAENTDTFKQLTAKLEATDEKLQAALDKANNTAEVLEHLVKFVDWATKVVGLVAG